MVESCFICGVEQAIWTLNSKPNGKNEPFFPFLKQESRSSSFKVHQSLDSNGQCLSCNICFVFLLQQWNSYEINETPYLKRLYWVKNSTKSVNFNEAKIIAANNSNCFQSCQNQTDGIKKKELGNEDDYCDENTVFSNLTSHQAKEEFKLSCANCSSVQYKSSMKFVHTTPQEHTNLPFFPNIISKSSSKYFPNGKIFVCLTCFIDLNKQWVFYENNSVPFTQRKYVNYFESSTDVYTCATCKKGLLPQQQEVVFLRKSGLEPYYPFLQNIDSCTFKHEDICYTFCCVNCKDTLKRQWDEFEKTGVCQGERVYSILETNSNSNIKAKKLMDSNSVQNCFVCHKLCNDLKQITNQTGANINLNVLVSLQNYQFEPNTNEVYVCLDCFTEIKYAWRNHYTNLSTSNDAQQSDTKCTLCLRMNTSTCKLFVECGINNSEPVFPILRSFCEKPDQVFIEVCLFCSKNLYNQWSYFKELNNLDECKYRLHDYVCCLCEKTVHYSHTLLKKVNLFPELSTASLNPYCVRVDDEVVVCDACAERSSKSSVVRETGISEVVKSMKATATVPPFFAMHNTQNSTAGATTEGSFAAALRKLAQQTPGYPSVSIYENPTSMKVETGSTKFDGPVIPPSIISLHHSESHKKVLRYNNMVPCVKERLPLPPMHSVPVRQGERHRSKDSFVQHDQMDLAYRLSPMKERSSSSIGLVHPQPIRRHSEEETLKSSKNMNSVHYNHQDGIASMRPSSPRYSSFHPPPTQSSCPVHGHEPGHTHEQRIATHLFEERRLAFDHLPRDFHSVYSQQPRARGEEIQLMHARHMPHPLERKELHPSQHALEEDLRRRGLDYRLSGFPPHLLDEHYRRHLLNASEQYKDPGQIFLPPHFYYRGRDHAPPVDAFPYHPPPDHRHPLSTSPMGFYRRGAEVALERRPERKLIEDIQLEPMKKKNNDNELRRFEGRKRAKSKSPRVDKMPFFQGIDYNSNSSPKTTDVTANSVRSLLSSKLPDSKTELAAASILANMNRMNQSPCSDEIESLSSSCGAEHHPAKVMERKIDDSGVGDKKLSYMHSIGLVTHDRKRVLEDDIERRRWDRKYRKFRGRPKKKSKREPTEESNGPNETREADYYSGPMTRHKQQMLQEQETLLEEIQRRHASTETNESAEVSKNTNEDVTKTQQLNGGLNESRNDHERAKRLAIHDAIHSPRADMLANHNAIHSPRADTLANHDAMHSPRADILANHNAIHSPRADMREVYNYRHVESELKMLDNTVFGRYMENQRSELPFRWPGIESITHSYNVYESECVVKRRHLLQTYERMQRDYADAQKTREYLEKDMMVYNDRRMRIAEKRQAMHRSLESLRTSLRALSHF